MLEHPNGTSEQRYVLDSWKGKRAERLVEDLRIIYPESAVYIV